MTEEYWVAVLEQEDRLISKLCQFHLAQPFSFL